MSSVMIVALYARVSTVKQAEKELSIPDQLGQMRAWCERQGHSVAVEYVERGASAMDDRRPAFQQMIAEACRSPQPFTAIVVHSQSRFFRDMVEFAVYERRLNRAGVKLLSITQPTGDDFSGEMLRRVISLFDEYQSKENGKHTLRAMSENARQGFFNGSTPLFGYRTEVVEIPGNKGKKKRLAVDEGEAVVVRKIFALYVRGDGGCPLGMLGVARALNRMGIAVRGRPWSKGRIETILQDRIYVGEHYFNKKSAKMGKVKPKEEWVVCPVSPIIEEEVFTAAQRRREAQHPSRVPPRVVSSPTFLTGILKCGSCGAGMTLATGKGGRYRYYKCSSRIRKGDSCESRNLPVGELDALVRQALCERVFTEQRVRGMLEQLRARLQKKRGRSSEGLKRLRAELEQNRLGSERLFEAVEKGLLAMDGTLAKRAHVLQARRQALLVEIAGIERQDAMPSRLLLPRNIQAFCRALKEKMLDGQSGFGKGYVRLLVEEIRVWGRKVVMRGHHASLAQLMINENPDGLREVPSLGYGWLPG